MSILSIFDIGKTALLANQTAISVTSHNIANVNNPDYSKQDVILGVKTPVRISGGYLGRGVSIDNIRRNYNKFLTEMLLNQENVLSRSSVLKDIIFQVEGFFNEANSDGIINSLNNFFNALQDLSFNASDISKRIVLLNSSDVVLSQFKTAEAHLEEVLTNINFEMSNIVKKINSISGEISELNKKINQLEINGLSNANDLRDKRDALLKELSSYVNINYYESSDKTFYVTVGMRNLIVGGDSYDFLHTTTEEGDRFTLDGIDITDRIKGGKLSGLLTGKNIINNEMLYKLRKLLGNFTNQVNLIHKSGYDLNNNTGNSFFNEQTNIYYEEYSKNALVTSLGINDYNNMTFDEYYINIKTGNVYEVVNKNNNSVIASGLYSSGTTINFDGLSVTISGSVSEGDRFFVSPQKTAIKDAKLQTNDPKGIALSSMIDAPVDNTNLNNLLSLKDKELTAFENKNIYEYYNNFVSKIGVLSKSADDNLKFEENIYNDISTKKQSVQGVSLDEEAVSLIKYQRAFEAAAKVIQVANELYESLVKLI